MKINGKHHDINVGPINRLIFRYQKLTRKFSELFFITIYKLWRILLLSRIGKPLIDLFMGVNLY
jgi:hypothetical protein